MQTVNIPQLECKRCGYKWLPRQSEVKLCPRCKSVNYDKAKKGAKHAKQPRK